MNRWLPAGLLLTFTLLVTLGLQRWVGGSTLYVPELEDERAEIHGAILKNRPLEGRTWEDMGARSTSTRIGAIWLAEGIHRATGMKLSRVYWLIDTVFLCATLILVFVLLKRWMDSLYSVVGLLYFVSVLPLTYYFHYFHPWDRISQLLWVLLFLSVKVGRTRLFTLALAASMLVKFDTLLAPALYWLANVTRRSLWPVSIRTLVLFAVSFVVLGGIVLTFPSDSSRSLGLAFSVSQITRNLNDIRAMGPTYPPLLAHLLPLVFAAIGWPCADRAARAGVVFGLALVPIWFLETNFLEVRAQLPLLILLLPCAVLGLKRLLVAKDS